MKSWGANVGDNILLSKTKIHKQNFFFFSTYAAFVILPVCPHVVLPGNKGQRKPDHRYEYQGTDQKCARGYRCRACKNEGKHTKVHHNPYKEAIKYPADHVVLT